jgi:hypothetical protein
MKRFEAEHFINTKPGNHLRFSQNDSEKIYLVIRILDFSFYLKITGINKCVMIKPPIKNPITATNDGSCRSLKPEIA